MINLTPDYDARAKVIQPTLNRTRAVFRAPIHSGSLNLMSDQMKYDTAKLKHKLTTLRSELSDMLEDLDEGGLTSTKSEMARYLNSTGGGRASTVDSADFLIDTDINITAKVTRNSWTGTSYLTAQRATTSTNMSFGLYMATNTLRFNVSTSGTAFLGTNPTTANIEALGAPLDRDFYIGATLDIDNGAGGNTRRVYYSLDGVVWTEVGVVAEAPVITSLFNSTASLSVGSIAQGSATNQWDGRIYGMEMRKGLVLGEGELKVRFNPQDWVTGTSHVTDGKTWSSIGGTILTGPVPVDIETGTIIELSNRILRLKERIQALEHKEGL